MNSVKSQSNTEGHRKRLRQRFLNAGRRALADYELLELLLTYVIPRKDTKPIAKALLRKHKSLTAILDQPIERLEETEGIGPQSSVFITLIRSCIERYLEQGVEQKRSISSPQDLMQFVRVTCPRFLYQF